jgi:iron complex outermembrane receptor protein
MFEKRILAGSIAAAAAMSGAGAPAYAEQTALEEIIVTATKREESIQDVPVVVTAISGDALERTFAHDARDLNGIAPNVMLQPVGAFQNATAFFVRGVGSSDIESATDPGIATFVDDAYQGRVSTAMVDFVDIQSVEILRGPQGTLFGRNAIGGVVHIRHAEPDLSETAFGGAVLFGEDGQQEYKAVVNVPLVQDKLAFRLAGKHTKLDGYYENESPGAPDVSGLDRLVLLPSLKWQATDELSVLIRGEWSETRDDSYANIPLNACRADPASFPPVGAAGTPNDIVIDFIGTVFGQPATAASYCGGEPSKDQFKVRHDQSEGSFSNFDVWGLTAKLEYDLPNGTLTYIGSYRDTEEDVVNDFDTTDFQLFSTDRIQDHWQTTHELRFAGDFGDRVSLVAGAYYFEQEYEMDQFTFGALVGGGPIFGNSIQNHDSWAIFGQADYRLTDQLVLIGGLRYAEENKSFDHCGVGAGDPVTRTCQLPGLGSTLIQEEESWNNVSPKAGIQYYFDDDVMAYFTWSRGFRSGGFNGRGNTPQSVGPFDEEEGDNWEIGIKGDFLDNRLRVNATAFLLDYQDLQRGIIRPAPDGGGGQETVTENVGSAEHRGFEVEVNALLGENLTLSASIGYLDAKNEEWCAPLQGTLEVDAPPAGFEQCEPSVEVLDLAGDVVGYLVPIDASGLEPAHAPKWSTRLAAVYELDLGASGSLTFGADWLHRSKSSLVAAGFPVGTTDGVDNYDGSFVTAIRNSHDIVNLNVTWRDESQRFRVSAFLKNATDERYFNTGTYVAGLFNFTSLNEPRRFGVEVAYNM